MPSLQNTSKNISGYALTSQEDWDPLGPSLAARSSCSARYSFTLSTFSALKPLMLLVGAPFCAPAWH